MRSSRSVLVGAMLASAVLTLAGCGGGGDASTAAAAAAASSGSTGGTSAASGGPSISGSPATSATVGSAYTFTPAATDASGASLTFSAKNLPSWASINASTGAISGTPAAGDVGTDSNIVISVSDGTMSASLSAFSISVAAAAVGTGRATISWTAPTQNTDGTPLTNLTGYQVVYGQSADDLSQSISISDPTATTYTISNLSSGTWYFGVVATTPATTSSVSALASKTI